ncbi:uncharacterized protein LY79DRAFT_563736 [Colletotrichum navitas]|uniref:Uncharacterized protein n=1 Tax=Colletotrichum navitas TaxID=681940 RepID=A0AAD8PST6_9PEZI|nr:uncharacterized protein LY79DRAFT_563736 [Colletotrichum navitas]KAK1579582.1 hypothetical protein LY79DRAFT_563736 [Colletotrichum navitas]
MEECSSVDYLGSLVTLCNTDKYQSICINDRKGHSSCNVTLGDTFSVAGDLQHFFLPYGTVAWISNVIGIWIWVCLINGKAPLNPNRAIKYKAFVYTGGIVDMLFLVLTAIVRVPQLKDRNLKLIAIGHVVAVVIIRSIGLLVISEKNPTDHKEPEKQGDEDEETRAEDFTEMTNNYKVTPQPSAELTRSTSSGSSVVSVSEKTSILEQITSNIPGIHRVETPSTSVEASTEAPKKEQTAAGGLWSLFLGIIAFSPGHVMMFCGGIGIAKQIFATHTNTDTRQQREVRDVYILFATITGIVIIGSIVGVVTNVFVTATQLPHHESADHEAAGRRRAAETQTVREAFFLGALILSCLLSLWCQYFVLAAAARDTHGIVHIGQTSNLSLVYLILSNLLLFAH